MTTVKDLIKHLETFDGDLAIITSIDDEGNGYRDINLRWVGLEAYDPDEMEVGILELTQELEEEGYSEEDIKPVPCIVIG